MDYGSHPGIRVKDIWAFSDSLANSMRLVWAGRLAQMLVFACKLHIAHFTFCRTWEIFKP